MLSRDAWMKAARRHRGLLAVKEPKTWRDTDGKTWTTPQAIGTLKFNRSAGYRALREFVRIQARGICQICGLDEKSLNLGDLCHVADHVISRRNGGSHHPRNLRWLCDSCNSRKSALIDKVRR